MNMGVMPDELFDFHRGMNARKAAPYDDDFGGLVTRLWYLPVSGAIDQEGQYDTVEQDMFRQRFRQQEGKTSKREQEKPRQRPQQDAGDDQYAGTHLNQGHQQRERFRR